MTQLTLTLGSRRTWRQYGPGRYENSAPDARGVVKHKFVPAVYENIEVEDSAVEGLLALAKQWAGFQRTHDIRGCDQRMVKVSNVKKLDKPDPPARTFESRLETLAENIVKKFLEAQRAAASPAAPKPKT